jgi:hypothetical protein
MAWRGFGEMGLNVHKNTIGKAKGIVNLEPSGEGVILFLALLVRIQAGRIWIISLMTLFFQWIDLIHVKFAGESCLPSLPLKIQFSWGKLPA